MATSTSGSVPKPWPRQVFRGLATGEAVLAFGQAILAGGFLQGHYRLLGLHQTNAFLVFGVALAMTVAATFQRRWAGGPKWPIFASLGVVAAIAVQMFIGFERILIVHVPLGVAIIGANARLAVWAWRGPYSRHVSTPPELSGQGT